eukprot:TRINITY_DN32695_c0_g1_i1.p1 TRINITY_DN32695_c0_g1~~TRINITY_DN32695_c0_g1_i1.p1  ORF type:complete len:348 (+),score=43.61 TRINITY_DN32695_c0_g1_i1:30-1046(+)
MVRPPIIVWICVALWCAFAVVRLRHFYATAVLNPKYERIKRDADRVRLPRFYFCPADRGVNRLIHWYSFECDFSYREENTECPATVKYFHGREPSDFEERKRDENDGDCLEFGTHNISAPAEWDVGWSELTLRASFLLPRSSLQDNLLKEIELGYFAEEFDIGRRKRKAARYYWRLLRVPYFVMPSSAPAAPGMSTRAFFMQDFYRSLHYETDNWMTYGALPIHVDRETLPRQLVPGVAGGSPEELMGVVHVKLTLDDWVQYDVHVESALYPLLELFGALAGVAAFLWLFVAWRSGSGMCPGFAAGGWPGGGRSPADGAGRKEEDFEEGERDGLLDGL